MLGCANGFKVKTKSPKPKSAIPDPFALTEYRRQAGTRRAPCLRQACLPSCARPRIGEERRASAQADECTGALLFGHFLLGKQEKVPRPNGRNQEAKQYLALLEHKELN